LTRQWVFCLTSPVGAIDIFRGVTGLPSWEACRERAVVGQTAALVEYRGLCDEDMIACQLALPEGQRRKTRIETLRRAISISNQQGRQT